ncbi:hypothetical protein [uncultured Stenotrophomonas sp.]|uniref:hypothetical protein n=1 Tax=uncultured Stenotrophomonas sp. TaxID=165438 RepID=UPI0025D70637|nr:hypothetical protein [uncultured Stenotrophomonas sp.]
MSTLEQLEAEARDIYPYPTEIDQLCRQVHVRARTISKEKAFIAALEVNAALCQHVRDGLIDIEVFHDGIVLERAMTRAAFRAAGFYVEEKEQ